MTRPLWLVLLGAFSAGVFAGCDDTSSRDLLTPQTDWVAYQAAFHDPIPDDLTDQWCVVLQPGADVEQIADELGVSVLRHNAAQSLALFQGPVEESDFLDVDGVRIFEENEAAIWSVPVELTLGFSQGEWSFEEVEGQAALAPLQLPILHQSARGNGVRVAVLDTGVDPDHPHLRGRVELLPPGAPLGSLETPNGIDDDGNGTADDAYGHGTHVSGIVLNVAPGAKVVPIRVLNEEGWGTLYDLAEGLQLVKTLDVDLVNLSLVLSENSPLIRTLIDELLAMDVVTVGAAGNTPGEVGFPASYAYCLGVAATDSTDELASFSGAYTAMMAAPGVKVASCFPGDKIAWGTGTSMATAVATGSLAAVRSYYENQGTIWSAVLMCFAGLDKGPPGALFHGRVRPLRAIWWYTKDQVEEAR